VKTTEFGEITQNNVITPVKVIQGRWFLYQSKSVCNFLLVIFSLAIGSASI